MGSMQSYDAFQAHLHQSKSDAAPNGFTENPTARLH